MSIRQASAGDSPKLRREQAISYLDEQYTNLIGGLRNLDRILPDDFLDTKLPPNKKLDRYTQKMQLVHASLHTYIHHIGNDPNILPDTRGGDFKELKLNFSEIRNTINALEALLPEPPAPPGFVERLQSLGESGRNSSDSVVSTGASQKKTTRNNAYILPGVIEREIRFTIEALYEYAHAAAPLVGVQLLQIRMTDKPRPDHSVVEHRDFRIKRKPLERPAELGTPEGWTKNLRLTVNMSQSNDGPSQSSGPAA